MTDTIKRFHSERYNGSSYVYASHETVEKAKSVIGNCEAWRIRDDDKTILEEHNGEVLEAFDKRMREVAEWRAKDTAKKQQHETELKAVQ
jgi:hypothetical protein